MSLPLRGSKQQGDLATFQDPMRELVARSKSVDIRAYEIATVDRIAQELQPATLAVLGDAKSLLATILDSGERAADAETGSAWASYLPFEHELDAAVAGKLGSRHAVEEIAFIAQLELRQREDRLTRIGPSQGATALLGECDSSLRRIRKALGAVDAAIAKAEDVAPLLDFASELRTSLAVRRAYAKLRTRLLAGGEPTLETLRPRFRAAGTQIAMLVGWDAYPDMRVQDRLLLRDLQQRILGWLRDPDATPAAGMRLWQDLAACVEMFALVNRRQELVAHDSAVVRSLIESGGDDHALLALEGLDAELDQLLAQREPDHDRRDRLARVLARLATQFSVGAGGPTW